MYATREKLKTKDAMELPSKKDEIKTREGKKISKHLFLGREREETERGINAMKQQVRQDGGKCR